MLKAIGKSNLRDVIATHLERDLLDVELSASLGGRCLSLREASRSKKFLGIRDPGLATLKADPIELPGTLQVQERSPGIVSQRQIINELAESQGSVDRQLLRESIESCRKGWETQA